MVQRSSIDDPAALAEAYAQLGADPGAGRRDALAFVLALVLVTLLLGSVRWQPADDREATPVTVVLEREPTPTPTARPTPPPTPPPTPLPRVASVTPAPVAQRAAPQRQVRSGGARPVPTVQPTTAPTAFVATSAPGPVPAGLAAGAPAPGTGSGNGTGAGSGGGAGSGSGAGAGTGSGNGTGGSGTGQVNADVPCGAVEFIPDDAARTVRGTMYERIRATVHFRDGHTESAVFPYEWVYPNGEQTDPWSDTNIRSQDAVPAQLPPPGTDQRRFPPLIRYILTHTSALGTTTLEECPTSRP